MHCLTLLATGRDDLCGNLGFVHLLYLLLFRGLQFNYVCSTQGWISTCDRDKIHEPDKQQGSGCEPKTRHTCNYAGIFLFDCNRFACLLHFVCALILEDDAWSGPIDFTRHSTHDALNRPPYRGGVSADDALIPREASLVGDERDDSARCPAVFRRTLYTEKRNLSVHTMLGAFAACSDATKTTTVNKNTSEACPLQE